ncbi:MAG: cell division protein ZapE [Maricaulaceae bacterium]|jgi:cell division protein ZapE
MSVAELYAARVKAGEVARDPEQEAAAARLSVLSARLAGWSPGLRAMIYGRPGPGGQGVYIHGAVGRGKSMLMDMFFEVAPTEKKRRAHFHEFMLDVHARIGAARAAGEKDPIAVAAKAIAEESWLLCFDELHVNDIGDAMILGRLFEALFGRGVVMVATSNQHVEDLYKDGLNRQLFEPFIELMSHHMDVVELDAARDYRLARLEGAPVWFAPADERAVEQMDEIWRAMTGGRETAETLKVQGRTNEVPRAGGGAARFTFEELCARPLGAADYLALTRRYHTLFIDDVPVLPAERRNEAKRFVTLIDALYETKTKLVASAAAEPDDLAPDQVATIGFTRAASRLIEMRSEAYLAAGRDTSAAPEDPDA